MYALINEWATKQNHFELCVYTLAFVIFVLAVLVFIMAYRDYQEYKHNEVIKKFEERHGFNVSKK